MRSTIASLGRVAAVISLVCLAPGALASGGSDLPEKETADPDLAMARKAIEKKEWQEAIRRLEKVAERQGASADVQNLLGYAERNRGNMDAAFAHYEKALRLDPKHRGAHEYVGEAYLMVGNLAKAKEHLAALDKLCRFSCEEYRDLKKKVASYERDGGSAR
jgi:tetratricopeptide (TPR) repeat protein